MTSRNPKGEAPSRRLSRRGRQAATGLSVLIVALVLFASQQDDGDGGGPLNAIAAAAERTQREPGGRMAMRAIVSSEGSSDPFTITGRGVYDEADRSRMVLKFPDRESGGSAEMEAVTDGAVMYMRSEIFGSLPDGSDWMALDLSFTEDLGAPLPPGGDATGELELLEAATGGVEKLDKEEVRGVPTTRYRGAVGVSENAERLREEGLDDLAAVTEEEGTPLRVEVWIDGDGLVRRTRLLKSQAEGEESGVIDMQLDFFDFGTAPEIDVPDEGEVFDATGQLRAELERAGGD